MKKRRTTSPLSGLYCIVPYPCYGMKNNVLNKNYWKLSSKTVLKPTTRHYSWRMKTLRLL